MLRRIKGWVVVLILLAVLSLDVLVSIVANRSFSDEASFVRQRMEQASLGADHGKYMDCEVDAVFYYYTYKTCFIRRTRSGAEGWAYRFYFARPFPIFLSFLNGIRFELIGTGKPNAVVYYDGTFKLRPH